MHYIAAIVVPLVAITCVGCGSDECSRTLTCDVGEGGSRGDTSSSTADSTSGSGTGSGGNDITKPTVISITPTDGATGVTVDTKIVVTFSEPMDQLSVEDALESTSLGAVASAWPAANRLELTPSLTYSTGPVANTYTFALTTAATDLAGNSLEEGVGSSFQTYRAVKTQLPLTFETTIDQDAEDAFVPTGHRVGQGIKNGQEIEWRVAMTYDMSSIPKTSPLLAADLTCGYIGFEGNVTGLGGLRLQRIKAANPVETYGSVALDDWPLFSFSTNHPASAQTTIDLRAALQTELSNLSDELQLRIAFTSVPSSAPFAVLEWTDFPVPGPNRDGGCDDPLEVTYLLP